ncbi:hypothetical protein A2153_04120 [Candidatus Gottesmanbacteria bacterium RBG_16_38_7b]|uniref:Transport permease protein n=1 Tax=Candidatus Gottesmanbacteria bacterium RBG_16_38_7b TaxID=1798372 RepID=A0A1F5YES7_9BACT|nr:MAG: hypothetical protein A2153_04120 [Candidatus Gottesmanbacteria bacterium RBG_16_38_7b]
MEKINWSAVFAIILRHIYTWRRDLDRLVDSFWWATMDLVFWGLTSTYVSQYNLGFDIVAVFIGGIIFWSVVLGSQRDINMPLLDEAWNRNLINLFTTPITITEFVIATLILGLTKLILTMSFLSLLAFVLYQYNIFRYGFFILPAFASLILTGWTVGLFIDGLILRYGYKVQSFAWALLFVIYPFSAVIYPVDILPEWARLISKLVPTSYVFENMRSVLFSGSINSSQLMVSFILNLIYLSLSLFFLRSMFKFALITGRLIKLN